MDSVLETSGGGRPRNIEEPLNIAVVHPVSRALLPLAVKLRIPPNAISVSGIGFGIVAAWAYFHYEAPAMALAGFAAMLAWHVCDGLDGMTARATGRTSDFGRFLDGFCDYSVYIMVYLSLAFSAADYVGIEVSLPLAIAAGAAHIVQAAWYELQREVFIRRSAGQPGLAPRKTVGGALERGYDRLQAKMMPGLHARDAALAADPALRARYVEALRPVLSAAAILGASGRTLAILIACLAGSPLWYWLWEIFGLSLAAIFIERARRAREAAL
ncbi:CDP-alcohol phosphatidyltransferase family protein [Sphingosinicella soli]|uniref:Phosphatidylglycerophosphate synthase n=1 Tax=Sphingosinicella soli TaxID=333708 RepID=A0A7W7F589_9SPHN|nr:CDP-alcohol phosphatidyltransferase family protein [Sphingosinicella soli]MBB4630454.1 phosphatidylglycerophosphate synthase [Sphingosinicella soli]